MCRERLVTCIHGLLIREAVLLFVYLVAINTLLDYVHIRAYILYKYKYTYVRVLYGHDESNSFLCTILVHLFFLLHKDVYSVEMHVHVVCVKQ